VAMMYRLASSSSTRSSTFGWPERGAVMRGSG
jgi:hypothetical protein